jgi:hypothetical protein
VRLSQRSRWTDFVHPLRPKRMVHTSDGWGLSTSTSKIEQGVTSDLSLTDLFLTARPRPASNLGLGYAFRALRTGCRALNTYKPWALLYFIGHFGPRIGNVQTCSGPSSSASSSFSIFESRWQPARFPHPKKTRTMGRNQCRHQHPPSYFGVRAVAGPWAAMNGLLRF